MGRPNSGLQEAYFGPLPPARKTPISIRYRPGVIFMQAAVCGRNNDAIILKEMNRLKSNFSAKSSIYYTPHGTLSLASLSPWLCLCTESMPEITEPNNAIVRCTKSLTPSPTVAIFHWSLKKW